ncbi:MULTISPECIES: helix-turn-helix domain-containing protein [Protofrankia]|uniref:helix-turn-helix domain-containing protein n=1 Tax=Protofrankia TaxID=2994361 RepID=UPI00069BBBC4|nr:MULTISPECIES: helix-turn-helix domain-containing protein [Protofrankia]ONH34464.1 hypothetical protein BL254_16435 [Protofrankia sp. BMG5.30]
MPPANGLYRVSWQLLERDEMCAALRARDFGAAFRLMKQYDGASQNRIASPVEGLTQSRISRVMRDKERIISIHPIERIADGLRIPGHLLRLAPRPWEIPDPASGPAPPNGLPPDVVVVVAADAGLLNGASSMPSGPSECSQSCSQAGGRPRTAMVDGGTGAQAPPTVRTNTDVG